MSILDDIIRGEIEFPRDFTHLERRPWGLLYHNSDIPDSHDSNHARILQAANADLDDIIAEMIRYYRQRGLTPRVYHLSRPGHGQAVRDALIRAGFTFSTNSDTFFLHRHPSAIIPRTDVAIERVTTFSPELSAMIERSENLRWRRVAQKRAAAPNVHFHVAFHAGHPVSVASLQNLGFITLLGDVLTDKPSRGRGFCRTLIHHLVAYHAQRLRNPLDLYTDNPTAARIYQEAGFVPLDQPLECWSAWQEAPGCSASAKKDQ